MATADILVGTNWLREQKWREDAGDAFVSTPFLEIIHCAVLVEPVFTRHIYFCHHSHIFTFIRVFGEEFEIQIGAFQATRDGGDGVCCVFRFFWLTDGSWNFMAPVFFWDQGFCCMGDCVQGGLANCLSVYLSIGRQARSIRNTRGEIRQERFMCLFAHGCMYVGSVKCRKSENERKSYHVKCTNIVDDLLLRHLHRPRAASF